jgi:acetyltransferase-like isoleucine patch superfamily enzyme
MGIRRFVARSDSAAARAARWAHAAYRDFSVPAPRPLVVPALYGFIAAREAYEFAKRVLVCEPLFKAYCKEYGSHLHTGSFIHYVMGQGDIVVGDHVTFDGKSTFIFAARFSERATLKIGDYCGFGHDCMFTVGKSITIGNHVRVASGTQIFDSPGHPADGERRKLGLPPDTDDVKPIVIEDNVWIGRRASIFPGVTIGEGSVVASGAMVMSNVPRHTTVAGNPARAVTSLKPRSEKVG